MIDPTAKAERMQQDMSFVLDEKKWRVPALHMKTQPWVQHQRFGVLVKVDFGTAPPYQVLIKSETSGTLTGTVETFVSAADLVERWSVD